MQFDRAWGDPCGIRADWACRTRLRPLCAGGERGICRSRRSQPNALEELPDRCLMLPKKQVLIEQGRRDQRAGQRTSPPQRRSQPTRPVYRAKDLESLALAQEPRRDEARIQFAEFVRLKRFIK
jgi:hypothetical protein